MLPAKNARKRNGDPFWDVPARYFQATLPSRGRTRNGPRKPAEECAATFGSLNRYLRRFVVEPPRHGHPSAHRQRQSKRHVGPEQAQKRAQAVSSSRAGVTCLEACDTSSAIQTLDELTWDVLLQCQFCSGGLAGLGEALSGASRTATRVARAWRQVVLAVQLTCVRQ
jgi:hypothetical protein